MNPIAQLKAQIDLLAPELWGEEIRLKRGEFLIQAGQVDTKTYYVEEGVIRIYYPGQAQDHTIRFAYRESVFAPLYSVLANQATKFDYQALRKTRLRAISTTELRAFLDQIPELQGYWTGIIEALVLDQLEREIDLITDSPRERYDRVLARSPQLFQEVPHKYIASYLRMSPETLSRLENSSQKS